jgi:hypothetical protein
MGAAGQILLDVLLTGVLVAGWTQREELGALARRLYILSYARASAALEHLQTSRVADVLVRFKASQALFAALELSVFELLSLRGPTSAAELVEDMGASEIESSSGADALAALLDALVELGLVERSHPVAQVVDEFENQLGAPLYSNSAAAERLLCRASPRNILAEARALRHDSARWSELADAVRFCAVRPPAERHETRDSAASEGAASDEEASVMSRLPRTTVDWVMDAYMRT